MGYEYAGTVESRAETDVWNVVAGLLRSMDGVSILREDASSMALRLNPRKPEEPSGVWDDDAVVEYDGDQLYVVVYAVSRADREAFLDALQSGLRGAGLGLTLEEL